MLLPPIQRTGEIHFHVAKGMPYRARLVVSFGLMAVGLALQLALLYRGPWAIGLVPMFAGVLLLLPRGYQNTVPLAKAEGWRPAHHEEVQRILDITERQKRWDSDAIDITSGLGLVALIFLVVVTFVVLGYIQRAGAMPRVNAMVAANAAVLLLPFWVTGVRFILKNNRLVIKAKMLLGIEDRFQKVRREGEEFTYQMQMVSAKGETGLVPQDVKAVVMFHNAPKEFLGLQMQVSINSVQGTDYPYYYCVLVARPEFGSFEKRRFHAPPSDVIIETSEEKDAVVAVIRQQTTRNSGYHTNRAAATEIFQFALDEARRLFEPKA